ncbi:MAG: 50S ribosomal protein L30 [Deltaproteobacteria bacterium]|jgi:large subunit ribosomal protein L30|nr:50S ribosomal protein L30 [Deltaproteobacteria bacterium]MBT4088561.1 50S ribosomal protein L30 [Deltaproteobacteria bacterium]MBT4266377.1 50S ribosomal protein L30 [Deltaproteobacteria bacterium]MBT4643939.1 50S ribosomal protein L30 [Deltaproteobacteria bacterium]MBT6502109.1 50S ribosomal protein L30 [Deltaproteobacteria bacterium]
MAGKIKVTQIRSGIGFTRKQQETLKGLGLRKMHQTRELEDTPAVRGMAKKISHLVRLEEA